MTGGHNFLLFCFLSGRLYHFLIVLCNWELEYVQPTLKIQQSIAYSQDTIAEIFYLLRNIKFGPQYNLKYLGMTLERSVNWREFLSLNNSERSVGCYIYTREEF